MARYILLYDVNIVFLAIRGTSKGAPLLEKNRRLVTDEPVKDELVEFEEKPVDIQDFRRITDHVKEIYERIYLK